MNDTSQIEIIEINGQYVNLIQIKARLEEYYNLESVGFDHSISPWEYVGLSKREFDVIKQCLTI
jgi:hypothetical protein